MSKGLSVPKRPLESLYSSMSAEIWKKEVIKQRGEYSQRLKLGRLINEKGSLSWATPQAMDFRSDVRKPEERSDKAKKGGCSNLREQVHNWPTPDTTNANDGVPWEKSKKQMEERRKKVKELVKQGKIKQGSGRSLNLATAVQKEKDWPTPTTAEAEKISNRANYGQKGLSNHPAIRGETSRGKLEKSKKKKDWPTPTGAEVSDGTRTKQILEGKWGNVQLREAIELEQMKNWGTPKEQDSRAASWDRGKSNLGEQVHGQDTPQDQAKSNTSGKSQESLKLNPNWVEQMMGLDVGWTQLPTEWID